MAAKKSTDVAIKSPETEVKTLTARISTVSSSLMTEPQNANDVAVAVGHRALLKDIAKDIKSKKDGIVKPMNEALKRVRELFKPVEEQVEHAIDQVTNGLSEYNHKAQEAIAEKEEELKERVEEGEITEEKAERILAKKSDKIGAAIIPMRIKRDIKIVNESLVPDRYWIIDTVALRRDVLTDGMKVPGVEITEADLIVNRRS